MKMSRSGRYYKPGTQGHIEGHSTYDYETQCWHWNGFKGRGGYGEFRTQVDGVQKRTMAHRSSYEVFIGPIPDGCIVHHMCTTKDCVNPEHLQAIGPENNVAEMFERKFYQKRIAELEARVHELEQQVA
jgi:hypothetical protein